MSFEPIFGNPLLDRCQKLFNIYFSWNDEEIKHCDICKYHDTELGEGAGGKWQAWVLIMMYWLQLTCSVIVNNFLSLSDKTSKLVRTIPKHCSETPDC